MRQRVEVRPITTAQARYTLERFHYLHRARMGRQVNYAILLDGAVDGVITYAYPMTSANILGCPPGTVIEFARMYLCSNLKGEATVSIGKTLRAIPKDWVTWWSDAQTPLLVVSWSDKTRHLGTVYRAANFVWLRESAGHRQTTRGIYGKRVERSDYSHPKDCWVYWLDPKRREEARKRVLLEAAK